MDGWDVGRLGTRGCIAHSYNLPSSHSGPQGAYETLDTRKEKLDSGKDWEPVSGKPALMGLLLLPSLSAPPPAPPPPGSLKSAHLRPGLPWSLSLLSLLGRALSVFETLGAAHVS